MSPSTRVIAAAVLTPMMLIALAGKATADPVSGPSWPIALSGSTQTGQYSPNLLDSLNAPQYFTGFAGSVSVIHSGGYVVFGGDTNVINGDVNGNQGGVWTWTGANSNVAKFTDTPALGGIGNYSTGGIASALIAGGSGQFGFRDGSGTSGTIYTNSGTPGRLIKALDVAPGTGGATFSSVGNLMTMNSSGSIATLATLTTGSGSPPVVTSGTAPYPNQLGFWAGTPGAMALKVRMGDQLNTGANVAIANTLVGTIDTSAYAYTDAGKLLWSGALQGSAVVTTPSTAATQQGLFSTRNGFAEVIARRGDSFPDASGATFTSATSTDGVAYATVGGGGSGMDMNNAGHVAYASTLRTSAGATPTTGGTVAVFSDNNGTLRTIARNTALVPASIQNGAGDMKWGTGLGNVIINSADTVLFSTTGLTGTGITSSTNSGVYKVSGAGVYSKVYQGGDAAPAWPAASGNPALNQTIAGAAPVFAAGTPSSIAMNAAGQLVFVAGLAGTGINTGLVGNQTGLFAMDTDGTTYLIAQKGMLFHVGPGDDRIVSSSGIGSINQTGNADGRASNIDDLGNIVYTLSFSDTVGGAATSSGVFYFHIPSPGAASLLGMGGLLAARRRRR